MAESIDEDINFIKKNSNILRTTLDIIGTKKDNLGLWNDIYGLQRRTNNNASTLSKKLVKMMLSTNTSDERSRSEIEMRGKIFFTELVNYKNLEEEIQKKMGDQRNRQEQIEEFKKGLLDITQIITDLEWGGFGDIIHDKETRRKPWYKRWGNTLLGWIQNCWAGVKFLGASCWTGLKMFGKYCWTGLMYCWAGLKAFGKYYWTGLKSFWNNCEEGMKSFMKYCSV